MEIQDFQDLIREIYYRKDSNRGMYGTFVWFIEEVGELARAIRENDEEKLEEEFSDVFAWLASLASLCNIDLEKAIEKYCSGCPKCGAQPCNCPKSK